MTEPKQSLPLRMKSRSRNRAQYPDSLQTRAEETSPRGSSQPRGQTGTSSQQQAATRDSRKENQIRAFSSATIRAMEGEWSSPASRAFASEYETLVPLYENYCEVTEAFTIYLDQTAASYQETEQILAAGMAS